MGLDSVELIMAIEDEFSIQSPGSEAEKIDTVGDMCNVVWKIVEIRQRENAGSEILREAAVRAQTTAIIAERIGFPATEIRPHHSFSRDLIIS